MKPAINYRIFINVVIIVISVCAWVLLLFNPGNIMTMEHCHISNAGPSAASLQMLLSMNPIQEQLAGWGLMVMAMMLPKLTIPILHIYDTSLKRFRFPLSLLFTAGYIATWMMAGIVLIAIIITFHLLMPGSWLPAIITGIVAIIWQCAPVKQRCLNRGHDHSVLSAFGWQAYHDAVLLGIKHGVWCVGSGWAIMLLPMLLPNGHNTAMLIVTLMMLSEHLEHPKVPRWRIDFRAKLFRIIAAQSQIKWKQLQKA